MRLFKLWLESQSQVIIDYSNLKKEFNSTAEKMIDYIREREDKISNFNQQKFFIDMQKLSNYPLFKNLMQALQSGNRHYIYDQQNKLRIWINDLPYKESVPFRDVAREIWTYVDIVDKKENLNSKEEDVHKLVQKAITGTVIEMEKLKNNIIAAIDRINSWHGSNITIHPQASEDTYGKVIDVTNTAQVEVGTGEYIPSFMIFQGDKTEIDDVLDGGDDDFFKNAANQADYFNLINELKKPGSTGKGKILTLFTARPKENREQFLVAKTLPVNIFLSNSYDHVEGIAKDMGNRDIWKVRIDSKYLTQTLDGSIKYYQVTTDNAPVKSMDLL